MQNGWVGGGVGEREEGWVVSIDDNPKTESNKVLNLRNGKLETPIVIIPSK